MLVVPWGLLKLELCSAIFPEAAPISTHATARVDLQGHCNSSLFLWSPPVSNCAGETPRLVKAKACQQSEQPGSSSKEFHSLGITRVLCPGTEHLFLETGATSVTPQPNQVSLPGLLPGTSASFQAKAHLLPAGGFPKPNSFLASSQRDTHSETSPDHWGRNQAAEMRLGPPLLKGGSVSCHLTPVCRSSASLCFLLWCLLFHKYSYAYFIWELFGDIFYWGRGGCC